MGKITSISLEETNRIRASLGLKTIPRPTETSTESKEGASDTNRKVRRSSQLSSRPSEKDCASGKINGSAQDRDKKIGQLKQRIYESKEAVDQRATTDKESIDDWLSKIGKPITHKESSAENATVHDDITHHHIPVSDELKSIAEQKAVIFTLKETSVTNDEENIDDENILENEKLVHDKQDAKNLKLRQLNKDRKLNKISIFDYSDEANDTNSRSDIPLHDSLVNDKPLPVHQSLPKRVKIESDSDDEQPYQDYAPVKIKRRKKKSNQNQKPRRIDTARMVKVDLLEDDEDFSDRPIQAVVKVKQKRSNEEITGIKNSLELEKLEGQQRSKGIHMLNNSDKGILLDETDEFLDSLKANVLDREPVNDDLPIKIDLKPVQKDKTGTIPATLVTDNDITQPDFSGGVAGMLNFLKERNIIKQDDRPNMGSDSKKHGTDVRKEFEILNGIANSLKTVNEKLDSNDVNFSEDELRKIKAAQAEEMALKIQRIQEEKLRDYNPTVELAYQDSEGNELKTKEAYKQLSQAWHGTKSSKKTLERQRKKMADRKKQLERDSYLGL